MILPNEKIIFIHIPKTGGASIENFLLDAFGYERNPFLMIHGYGVNLNTTKSKFTIYPHMHYPLKDLVRDANKNNIVIDDTWRIFSIVRNPYFRFISDLFYQESTPLKYQYHMLPEINRVNFIDQCVDLYLKSDTNENYHSYHSLPQYKFFEDTDLVCSIFRFEDGLEYSLTSMGFEITKPIPHELNLTKVFGTPKPDYNEVLTKKLVETVNQMFEEDFNAFGYEMLDPSTYPC